MENTFLSFIMTPPKGFVYTQMSPRGPVGLSGPAALLSRGHPSLGQTPASLTLMFVLLVSPDINTSLVSRQTQTDRKCSSLMSLSCSSGNTRHVCRDWTYLCACKVIWTENAMRMFLRLPPWAFSSTTYLAFIKSPSYFLTSYCCVIRQEPSLPYSNP